MKAVSHNFRVVSLSWAGTIVRRREEQATKRQRQFFNKVFLLAEV